MTLKLNFITKKINLNILTKSIIIVSVHRLVWMVSINVIIYTFLILVSMINKRYGCISLYCLIRLCIVVINRPIFLKLSQIVGRLSINNSVSLKFYNMFNLFIHVRNLVFETLNIMYYNIQLQDSRLKYQIGGHKASSETRNHRFSHIFSLLF